MGNLKADFPVAVHLSVNDELQIRHNALEAARLSANRHLEKALGKQGFHLKVRSYPHHFLRENPLASGAGADRMSTGMKCAFGKIVGLAAQFRANQEVYSAYVNPQHLDVAKKALLKAAKKLPCSCRIRVEYRNVKPVVMEEDVPTASEFIEDAQESHAEATEESAEPSEEKEVLAE
jgi:large subunit ribosomal protein L10e